MGKGEGDGVDERQRVACNYILDGGEKWSVGKWKLYSGRVSVFIYMNKCEHSYSFGTMAKARCKGVQSKIYYLSFAQPPYFILFYFR